MSSTMPSKFIVQCLRVAKARKRKPHFLPAFDKDEIMCSIAFEVVTFKLHKRLNSPAGIRECDLRLLNRISLFSWFGKFPQANHPIRNDKVTRLYVSLVQSDQRRLCVQESRVFLIVNFKPSWGLNTILACELLFNAQGQLKKLWTVLRSEQRAAKRGWEKAGQNPSNPLVVQTEF